MWRIIAILGKEGEVQSSDLLNQLNGWNHISLLKTRKLTEEGKITPSV